MRFFLFSILVLYLVTSAGAQSLADSLEFRKVFLKVFNGRIKHFRTIWSGETGSDPQVELPGSHFNSVEPFYGSNGDSNFVFEARYDHRSQTLAAKAWQELLQLVRISLKPYVFAERKEGNGNGKVNYFFQKETLFYFDSYVEAELEQQGNGTNWQVILRVYDRPLREIYFADKGPVTPDADYKRVLKKTAFSTRDAFNLLKGKKVEEGVWLARDSIPGYRAAFYENDVFELFSGFQSDDERKSLQFFDELNGRLKSAMPPGYAYYASPEPEKYGAMRAYIFHKAYEEVNSYPAYPGISFLLSRDEKNPATYYVVIRVIRM